MAEREGERNPELEQGLLEAMRLTENGEWSEAFRVLRELEEDHPEDALLLCTLGVVSGEVEARGLAYEYFRRALAADPTDPAVLVQLGVGLARYDDPEAERVLRLAALTAPELPAARLQYGAYLSREGLHEAAIRELKAAQELDGSDALIVRELGIAYFRAGDREAALESLEAAAGLADDDAELRLLYGLALVVARRVEEGAEELYRASSELADDGDAQLASALASATQGWMDEAWNALARAEGAALAPDPLLLAEAEEAIEEGEDAAEEMLVDTVAAPMLHERLMERP